MPESVVSSPRIHEIVARLSEGLVERDEILRVALLGTVAGENVLLLGPPGTAKSMLARRMAGTFSDVRYFQYMLTRFTSPDELFGPVSLRQLKDSDEFRRKVEGYLPTTEVAFIDEVFKASSAILNSLLTLLNERIYFNGGETVRSPLMVLLAASNETPAEEELAALVDRFTVRLVVAPVQEEENVLAMLRHPEPTFEWAMPADLRLSRGEVARLRAEAADVALSSAAERVILRIKRDIEALSDAGETAIGRWYISDRRWRHAVRFLRMAALLNGREAVHPADCALLRHNLWNEPEDEPTVAGIIERAFEDSDAAFGLDMRAFVERWVRMLGDIRAREGLARPLYNGYVLTHGAQKYVMTDLRASEAMQNTWESVRATGFYFDGRSNQMRRVRLRQDGTFQMNVGMAAQPAVDAATYASLQRGGGTPQVEDGAVVVERRVTPGMTLDFSLAPQAMREMYQRELGRLMVLLEEAEADRTTALDELDEVMRDHLFVPVAAVRGLRAGLVRSELVIKEWEVKVRTLIDALRAGTAWDTTDMDIGGGSTLVAATGG